MADESTRVTLSGAESLLLLVRDVSALAASTNLDRETDYRRVLPSIAPAVLWRVLPRMFRRAAQHIEDTTTRAFVLNLAATIEGKRVQS